MAGRGFSQTTTRFADSRYFDTGTGAAFVYGNPHAELSGLFFVAYSIGLRLGERCRLQTGDIDA
jgi:hypothetical protein